MNIFMPCAKVAGLGTSAADVAVGFVVVVVVASLPALILDPGLPLLRTLAVLLKSLAGYMVASQIPPPIASIPPPIAST